MKKSILKIVSVCLSLCVMLSMFSVLLGISVSAQTYTEYTIEDFDGKYKTQGRTEVENGVLMLDWSASGMVFNADCSGDVSITVVPGRLYTDAKQGVYFTVVVDGEVQYEDMRIPYDNKAANWTSNTTGYPFHITESGESTFTIASGLSSGEHTFEIYNQTEAMDGSFGIKKVALSGEITEPPADSDLYIEFVGDSITAGLGNISVGGNGAPLYQDATRGWAYLTAKRLGADWSVVAQSGIAATSGLGWGDNPRAMPEMYTKLRYEPTNTAEYDFAKQPDVIVIGLGTNDIWTYESKGKTLEDVQQGFVDLLNLVREKNPDSKIVWVHNMMIGTASTTVESAIEAVGGEEAGFYAFKLTLDTLGGQGHPGIEVQPKWAYMLSEYIDTLVNGTSDTETEITYAGGDGSQTNPYKIETAKQLNKMVMDGGLNGETAAYYVLNNDIEIEMLWDITGSPAFVGNFSGKGHTISGLYTKNDGFVNTLSGGGVISDVIFEKSVVSGSTWVGTVVGTTTGGTISNVIVNGSKVSRTADWGNKTGGIVGLASDNTTVTIKNCAVINSNADRVISGCASWNFGVQNISDCYAVECTATAVSAAGSNANKTDVYLISDPATIKGEAAKETMPNLDWKNTWQTGAEGEYPTLQSEIMSGSGTKNDPYLITNSKQLNRMVMDGGLGNGAASYYELMCDIELNVTADWAPDADNTKGYSVWTITGAAEFKGTFCGNGHTISGLYTKNDGFIGVASSGASVTDVVFENCYVRGGAWVGTVLGTAKGVTLKNVMVKNSTVAETAGWGSNMTGGLIGIASDNTTTNVINCAVINTDSKRIISGCASWNFGVQNIINCYAVECTATAVSGAGSNVNQTNMYIISEPDTIKGTAAKAAMPALDYALTWKINDSEYPTLRTLDIGEVWDGTKPESIEASGMEGNGTQTEPYEITNGAQLYAAVNTTGTADIYFELENDIYLDDPRMVYIGKYDTAKNWYKAESLPFVGSIDGNGHTVYGLYSNTSGGWGPSGLIRALGMGGTVEDLHLSHSYLTAPQFNVGGLVGQVTAIPDKTDSYTKAAVISGCSVTCTTVVGTQVTENRIGAIVGNISSDVHSTYQTEEYGNVKTARVKLDIRDCYTADNTLKYVSGDTTYINDKNAGGLIGRCYKYAESGNVQHIISVTDCYTDGNVPFGANSADYFHIGMSESTVSDVYTINLADGVTSGYSALSYSDMTGLYNTDSAWYQVGENQPRLISATADFVYPDLDGDGVDAAPETSDLVALKKSLLGIKGYNLNNAVGNVNGDSSADGTVVDLVDIRDLIRLKKYLAGNAELKKKIIVDYDALLLASAPNLANVSEYSLTWQDEFNSPVKTHNDYDPNWQFQWCVGWADDLELTRETENVSVKSNGENSYLSMRAVKTGDGTYTTAAPITTCGKMSYLYGYLEIRASVPYGQGMFPAFWLKSTNAQYAQDGNVYVGDEKLGYNSAAAFESEVDVFEIFGTNSMTSNIHKYWKESGAHDQAGNHSGMTASRDISGGTAYDPAVQSWHTYGFEWTPDVMTMYIDGEVFNTFDLNKNLDGTDTDVDKSGLNSPLSVILNLSLFTDGLIQNNEWLQGKTAFDGSAYDVNDTVASFDVDYIRLYQKSDGKLWTK